MSEELHQKNNQLKSQEQSKESGKKEVKRLPLNGLLYVLCFSVIGFVGINFASCNFAIPGSLHHKWVTGQLKNEPKIDCVKTQNDGLMQILGAAGLLFAFKAKADD
jgi:hypothetical protein